MPEIEDEKGVCSDGAYDDYRHESPRCEDDVLPTLGNRSKESLLAEEIGRLAMISFALTAVVDW